MDQTAQDRWLAALRDHAARLSFPDWERGEEDWTTLYTTFDEAGSPVTEVAVYRGHDRIHYHRYTGAAVTPFWTNLLNEAAE
ncbi:hypothetical protein ACIBHX_26925 [Nonomuraea sp. NPDC050536]|uniref:hypothetical protein n=1 Tax=Nonomuraea sp. NPDC050536 TaxID=3364366 RepID=UPI0037C531A4